MKGRETPELWPRFAEAQDNLKMAYCLNQPILYTMQYNTTP